MILISGSQKLKEFEMPVGDKRYATVNFNNQAGRLGTSVSSVAWSIDEGSVTISSPTLSTNVARALLTSSTSPDCSVVKIKATLADTQTITEYMKINVYERECC